MDKFYVITNKSKDVTLKITKRIKEYLVHLQKTEETGTLAEVEIDWKQIVENAFETLAK